MKIDDYEKADCTLYRIPPVDLSQIQASINKTLAEVWEKGGNVNNAIDNVLNNDGMIGDLQQQIAKHVNFQKKTALDNLNQEEIKANNNYVARREEALSKVEAAYGQNLSDKEKSYQDKSKELQNKRTSYSASQARLEKIRYNIQHNMQEIGGKEGLEKLLQINDRLTRGTEKPAPPYSSSTKKSSSKKGKAPTPKTAPPLPPGSELETTVEAKGQAEEGSLENENLALEPVQPKYKHFFKKVWKVLNYKIF